LWTRTYTERVGGNQFVVFWTEKKRLRLSVRQTESICTLDGFVLKGPGTEMRCMKLLEVKCRKRPNTIPTRTNISIRSLGLLSETNPWRHGLGGAWTPRPQSGGSAGSDGPPRGPPPRPRAPNGGRHRHRMRGLQRSPQRASGAFRDDWGRRKFPHPPLYPAG